MHDFRIARAVEGAEVGGVERAEFRNAGTASGSEVEEIIHCASAHSAGPGFIESPQDFLSGQQQHLAQLGHDVLPEDWRPLRAAHDNQAGSLLTC